MNDHEPANTPAALDGIRRDTERIGFTLASEPKTGSLLALSLLKVGGIHFVDDLLPLASWPEGHAPKVPALIAALENRPGFVAAKLAWASGLMMLVRTNAV